MVGNGGGDQSLGWRSVWLGWSGWRSVIHGSWIMGLVGDGDGDEDGWVWLERVGFFWVWSGWRSVVEVVVFVGEGWVFLGLVGVEIGGQGGHFCWRGLGFSGFGRGGDWWSGWSFLLERSGFFWVWSGWRSVVEVVVFVGKGWVFLGLIGVEIGGRFCTV